MSGFKLVKPKTINKEKSPMKNILIAGLLVVSSAAFAGGRNANEPVNPPQPPIVVEESSPGICAKFYNKTIPHYHYEDVDLHAWKQQTPATVGFETVALVGANGFCTLMAPLKAMESLCHWARANGISCVSGEEWQFTRPDAP